ncbi:response regulator [Sulfitobacter mediterraneus]|jgi:two-component system, OmpR family, phosphate regulon response regulator PhoB|uniref:Response regulator receiver domain-containing protein n=1 Tax=Sulfitobacter mediterraneus TaxID=83219 RepID=A0A2T6CAE8_9RHOB|nr:response regulator [Sulfitobacter mediterraneus]KIN79463.1 Response regulator receiver domain protein [Sulfitobacter mediterraneus KCTC 32188]MBM1311787.1 response regulator [Sulfitobacter mediterraneus]MBM1315669.1 response regulator [Sulfitobacter mediterraneus]MBM1324030.1 response regulator [Sulfitobacter mediterraneus]MBM1327942.1 response regulator [Sulfitobacter mediterraneus]
MINLLHVEDDADIREIAMMALGISGEFAIIQCESGDEALSEVENSTPDVILLDMMMPGMTGLQTLQHMRKMPHLAEVPAIFMTARTQQSDVDELRAMGNVEVITKPFDPMTLSDQIKEAMAKIDA